MLGLSPGLGIICNKLNYTRQGYYKHRGLELKRQSRDCKVLEYVAQQREVQPGVGVRKLQMMLSALGSSELTIGRDELFNLLREHKLLIRDTVRRVSFSKPGIDKVSFPNLLPGLDIKHINQAWVTDITYLNTCSGFVYLYLITDLYSRKVISYLLAEDLSSESACKALRQALKTVSDTQGIIHHSDHGCQYTSRAYQSILAKHHLVCSLTGRNRCYDNAVAERLNGILKHEFMLKRVFPDFAVAAEAVREAVRVYNHQRLHAALGYRTPDKVYADAA